MTDKKIILTVTEEEFEAIDALVSFWTVEYMEQVLGIEPNIFYEVIKVRHEELTKGE